MLAEATYRRGLSTRRCLTYNRYRPPTICKFSSAPSRCGLSRQGSLPTMVRFYLVRPRETLGQQRLRGAAILRGQEWGDGAGEKQLVATIILVRQITLQPLVHGEL